MMVDLALKPGDIFDDRYQIVELLGSGGIGSVFKALQLDCQRIVAIKVVHVEWAQDEEMKSRFLQEAQVLNRLRNEHIVNIYHLAVSATGLPYMAFELLEGKSLRKILEEEKQLTLERTCKIIMQACQALDIAHKEGIVHRDLKPENMILLQEPEQDFLKIIDFGLAKFISADNSAALQKLTQTGLLIGSVYYMSPEQCQARAADQRSDIYSLTVCFFEMLTGERPFNADNSMGLLYLHVRETIPRLKLKLPANLQIAVQQFVDKGLAKAPENRFQSMEEMSASLALLMDQSSSTFSLVESTPLLKAIIVPALAICIVGGAYLLISQFIANRSAQNVVIKTNSSGKKTKLRSTVSLESRLSQLIQAHSRLNLETKSYPALDRSKMLISINEQLEKITQNKSAAQALRLVACMEQVKLRRKMKYKPDIQEKICKECIKLSLDNEGKESLESSEAYYELASAYYDLKEYANAESAALKALDLKNRLYRGDPTLKPIGLPEALYTEYPRVNRSTIYSFLAHAAARQGNYQKALKLIDLSFEHTPEAANQQALPVRSKAQILFDMGRRDDAIEVCETFEKHLFELSLSYKDGDRSHIARELIETNPLQQASDAEREQEMIEILADELVTRKEYKTARNFLQDIKILIKQTGLGVSKQAEIERKLANIDKLEKQVKNQPPH